MADEESRPKAIVNETERSALLVAADTEYEKSIVSLLVEDVDEESTRRFLIGRHSQTVWDRAM